MKDIPCVRVYVAGRAREPGAVLHGNQTRGEGGRIKTDVKHGLTLTGLMETQIAIIMSMLKAADPTIVPGPRSPASKSFPITCREREKGRESEGERGGERGSAATIEERVRRVVIK